MKKVFSKYWKSSKQPRKQRKYIANAPLHIKRKMIMANLSKELRKEYSRRSLSLRKGDTVKIMRGKFKGKKGKILEINQKTRKVYVEGIQVKKRDGSKVNFALRPSKLQILELNKEDKKRINIKNRETKQEGKKEKIENKLEIKKNAP